MGLVYDRWRARTLLKNELTEAPSIPITGPAVQSGGPQIQPIRPPVHTGRPPISNPQRQKPSGQPLRTAGSMQVAQMREGLQSAANPKNPSLANVKSMLNNAFNRDM